MVNLLAALALLAQGVDVDKLLERADKDVQEARAAKDKGGDAAYLLELARIRYLVAADAGSPKAADGLKAVQQLRRPELAAPGESAEQGRAQLQLAEALAATDQYDLAERALAAAQDHAKRENDDATGVRAATRSREYTEMKARFLALKTVRQTLAATPDDAAACAEMGQYLGPMKGDWEPALRFLARGSDAALKPLAERELAPPSQPAEWAAIGDQWWTLAEQEKDPLRKGRLQSHARQLYRLALPGLAGLSRMKIEKRLDAPDPDGGAINLMKLIDLSRDVVFGGWTLNGDAITSNGAKGARVEIPYEPPAEYDLKVVFTRNDGIGDVFLALTNNRRAFEWTLGAGGNKYYGFGIYKGLWAADANCQGSVQIPDGLTNGKLHTTLVQVRKDSLKGYLDGKLIKELNQPYGDLEPHGSLRLRNDAILGVGTWISPTTVHKIELVEISGRGRKTR